jgi:hypothetical protein
MLASWQGQFPSVGFLAGAVSYKIQEIKLLSVWLRDVHSTKSLISSFSYEGFLAPVPPKSGDVKDVTEPILLFSIFFVRFSYLMEPIWALPPLLRNQQSVTGFPEPRSLPCHILTVVLSENA